MCSHPEVERCHKILTWNVPHSIFSRMTLYIYIYNIIFTSWRTIIYRWNYGRDILVCCERGTSMNVGNVVRNGTPWYTQNPITPFLLGHCLLHASMASHWVNEVWFLLLGLPTEGLKSICYVYIYILYLFTYNYTCLLFMDMNGGMVRSTFWGASKDILHSVSGSPHISELIRFPSGG